MYCFTLKIERLLRISVVFSLFFEQNPCFFLFRFYASRFYSRRLRHCSRVQCCVHNGYLSTSIFRHRLFDVLFKMNQSVTIQVRLRNSCLQTNLTQGCRNNNKRFYSNERSFHEINFTTTRRLTRPTPLE